MRPHRALVAGVVLMLASGGAITWQGSHRQIPLYQEGVTRDVRGALVPVAPGRAQAGWVPVSGWPETLPWEAGLLAAQEASVQTWLASGWLPDPEDPHAQMARDALRDLHTLTAPAGTAPGAVLAGASPAWRFVWPRDASFVAAAYARTGHEGDALAVLLLLQQLQAPDGSMQARYLPDGSGRVPDARPGQEDGPGWALWATRQLIDRGEDLTLDPGVLLAPLVTRSTARLLARLDPGTGLPRPSPDYWERPEEELTLGIAATSLMGLEAAAALAADGAVPATAWQEAGIDPADLDPEAARLRERIVTTFGPGFPRSVGGRPDAAVTFLLPPFLDRPVEGADAARLASQRAQARPAGGVAPGAGWRPDGVSWTPQTALQALAAQEMGHPAEAERWLTWLDRHRTDAGALPEKVLHDGDPAAVAPLAWTAALVLLTLTG